MFDKIDEAISWRLIIIGILLCTLPFLLLYNNSRVSGIDEISIALVFIGFGSMCIVPGIGFFLKRRKIQSILELSAEDRKIFYEIGTCIFVIISIIGCIITLLEHSIFFFGFISIFLFAFPSVVRYMIRMKKVKNKGNLLRDDNSNDTDSMNYKTKDH